MRITVRVPATSANLGPGFDCLGLALELCNEVTLDTAGSDPSVTWEGEGAGELPTDGSDMVSRAIAFAAAELGDGTTPGFSLHGTNRIPLERGLGSSSAAAVAGIVLAHEIRGSVPADPASVFALASAFEGHPDNAAAAVHGGLTIAVGDEGGSHTVVRLDPHPFLRPVVLIPQTERLPTDRARRALSPEVSRGDAVANLQHTALAVVALTRDPSLLGAALVDRLHQQARLELVPEVAAVFGSLQRAGVPVCVSGAGPALLAFRSEARSVPNPPGGWRILDPEVRPIGYEVDRN
ncbi:MAG: homoserine kinase [Actinomycetota bacterium]